jgi:predicted PurR-regulated permease PerM
MATDPTPAPPDTAPSAPTARVALFALTTLAVVACAWIAWPFLSSLAWACALAAIWGPAHRRIQARLRWPTTAALLSVAAVALLLIVPIGLVLPKVVDEAARGYQALRAMRDSGAWDATLAANPWIRLLLEWVSARVDVGDLLQRAGSLLTLVGSVAVRTSFAGVADVVLTFFWLFFFLRDRDALLRGLSRLIPMPAAQTGRLLRVASDTVIATVYGKVLVGIVQGVLGGLMFWFLDLPAAWFWAVAMAVLSMVPLLGPPMVWVPAAAWLAISGDWWQAIVMVTWGGAVVGVADNVLYPLVVGRYLRLHTVPMLVALIGGILMFGAAGFFLGPVVLAVTAELLRAWDGDAEDDAGPG